MTDSPQTLHLLEPGGTIAGDWYHGSIPTNIQIGRNVLIESSHAFKNFRSQAPCGLRVGNDVTFWRTSLATERDGVIEIGDACFFADASIVSVGRITIGDRVVIGGGVTIADSDFHPLDPAGRIADAIALSPIGSRRLREQPAAYPVVIEDDVWIGVNATILKGVRIGAGAIVSPAAVVTRDVPPGATVAGNPARVAEGA